MWQRRCPKLRHSPNFAFGILGESSLSHTKKDGLPRPRGLAMTVSYFFFASGCLLFMIDTKRESAIWV